MLGQEHTASLRLCGAQLQPCPSQLPPEGRCHQHLQAQPPRSWRKSRSLRSKFSFAPWELNRNWWINAVLRKSAASFPHSSLPMASPWCHCSTIPQVLKAQSSYPNSGLSSRSIRELTMPGATQLSISSNCLHKSGIQCHRANWAPSSCWTQTLPNSHFGKSFPSAREGWTPISGPQCRIWRNDDMPLALGFWIYFYFLTCFAGCTQFAVSNVILSTVSVISTLSGLKK